MNGTELGLLTGIAVRSCVVLALAGLAARALRRRSAAVRHGVWLAGLAGIVVLTVVAAVAPRLQLPWLPPAVGGADAALVDTAPEGASATNENAFPHGRERGALGNAAALDRRGIDSRIATTTTARSIAASGTGRPWPGRAALLAYLIGAAILLVRLLLGVVGALRLGRRARPVARQEASTTFAAARGCADSPAAQRALLATSNEVRVPVTFGLTRPLVVVPQAWASWPDTVRDNVIRHEIAHVDRFDWPVQLFARAVCALYWFNPFVWLAARCLYVEAEQACDERVLASGSSPADYAEQLLLLSRSCVGPGRLPLVAIARPSDLLVRIESIHRIQRGVRPMSRHSRLAVSISLIAAASLLGSAELTAQQPAQMPQPQRLTSPAPAATAQPETVASSTPEATAQPEPVASSTPEATAQPESVATSTPAATARSESVATSALEPAPSPSPAGQRRDPLLTAASRGDVSEVARLLDAGADPNLNVPGAGTPLILAASGGHTQVVQLLLQAGADPNLVRAHDGRWRGDDELMRTALTEAARRGRRQVVVQLLEAGADIDAVPPGDASAVMEAAQNGHEQIVRLLVERGADVDRAIPGDGTALIAAARGGSLAMLRLLVDHGADVNRTSPGDGNALIAAVRRGDHDMVRFLLDAGADPFQSVPGDESALVQAAEHGDREMLRLLMDGRR